MSIIKVLSPEQAQKIAAGEVIERPAHIVKELIENSIDAGAREVTIAVHHGGKTSILVADNGCGMERQDARLCFYPHATSKLSSVDELTSISSYGFRGEALASIAAVSNVRLVTKNHQEEGSGLGVCIEYRDGVFHSEKEVAASVGTTITVEDLFATIPVRKKFLRTDETEYNAIAHLVHACMLTHQSIHFKLLRDEECMLNAPPVSSLSERISQIWSYSIVQHMQELDVSGGNNYSWLSFSGMISSPQSWRHNRNSLFFFVNNRWIKNAELSKAFIKGYLNVLPPGKFPTGCIFINVDSDFVDINVHPKKEEVRFVKPMTVHTSLTRVVTKTLEQHLSSALTEKREETLKDLSMGSKTVPEISPASSPFAVNNHSSVNFDHLYPIAQQYARHQKAEQTQSVAFSEASADMQKNSASILSGHQQKRVSQDKHNFKIVGHLFATYIIIEQNKECLFIDQHAAHERILYEKMRKQFENKDGVALLFPETLSISQEQYELLNRHAHFFSQQGILYEYEKKSFSLSIKAAPPIIQHSSLTSFMQEVLAFMVEHEHLDEELFRKQLNEFMHGEMACKGAVKAGDRLSVQQMEQLIVDLLETERRFICVHGRPTIFTLSQGYIAKQFQRT